MTVADQAINAAISLEAKKDGLVQKQSGDWKMSFTVQAIDMSDRLTKAPMGTRFAMVLVEIGDDELPAPTAATPLAVEAPPEPVNQPRPARAKRDWRNLQPSQQAGIRSSEPMFWAFLTETRAEDWNEAGGAKADDPAADCIRMICGVGSRSELNTNHAARVIWHQLNDQYEAWLRVGA